MADGAVTEITPASELNGQPPKFVSSTEGLPPPMDDNAVRAIFAQAAANGIDELNAQVQTPAHSGQPQVVPQPTVVAPLDVPVKFQRPDGTVDEEKLKASSAQLDQAIEQKQKTIDEILNEYKDKERQFQELGGQAKQLQTPQAPAVMQVPQQPLQDETQENLRQRILRDFQSDPVGTMVEIAKLVARKETEPIQQVAATIAERDRDAVMRSSLAKLAESDPRILDPKNFAVVNEILGEDPALFRLKNPHKAGWNEAKERLRLGEFVRTQAQPSNLSPILGRGTPAPVSGLPVPSSPQSLFAQTNQVDPYSAEGKALEEKLKAITSQLWQ